MFEKKLLIKYSDEELTPISTNVHRFYMDKRLLSIDVCVYACKHDL